MSRSFEERALNGTISRFEPGVHTQRLKKSAVDADLVRRIEAGMTETSQWLHDQPRGGHATLPKPADLREDRRRSRRVVVRLFNDNQRRVGSGRPT